MSEKDDYRVSSNEESQNQGANEGSQSQDGPPPPAKPLAEEQVEKGQNGSEHTRQDEAKSNE